MQCDHGRGPSVLAKGGGPGLKYLAGDGFGSLRAPLLLLKVQGSMNDFRTSVTSIIREDDTAFRVWSLSLP